jgi:nicotinamidase-related amidase
MATLSDRPNTALLVIDVQNGVVAHAHNRDGVIANIGALVDRARAEDVPVVWVQHADEAMPRDSESWQYVPELARSESEPRSEDRGHRRDHLHEASVISASARQS